METKKAAAWSPSSLVLDPANLILLPFSMREKVAEGRMRGKDQIITKVAFRIIAVNHQKKAFHTDDTDVTDKSR
jgi:hypothetical protein